MHRNLYISNFEVIEMMWKEIGSIVKKLILLLFPFFLLLPLCIKAVKFTGKFHAACLKFSRTFKFLIDNSLFFILVKFFYNVLDFAYFLRLYIYPKPCLRCRLINKIDRLVRKESVIDISFR